MKRKLQALVVFILIGIGKLPLEQRAEADLRGHDMLYAPLEYTARDAVGQMGFAATLGGLRSLVASVTYLMGFTAFEDVNWSRVDMLFGITTMLQPRFDVYWDDAAEHMAYDAASYYRYDESRPSLYRKQLYRQHVQRGVDILNDGLRHLPQNDRLHTALANIYGRRVEPPNHELAGTHYLLAFQNGGLPVYERLAAYEWAQLDDAPGRWQEAYAILKHSYGRGLRLPGAINFMHLLENKLNIPEAQRVR